MMTKEEFLKVLNEHVSSELADRDRPESAWWLVIEFIASKEYKRRYDSDR